MQSHVFHEAACTYVSLSISHVCFVEHPGVMPLPGFPVRHCCEGSAHHPQQAAAAALPEERHSRSQLGVLCQPL